MAKHQPPPPPKGNKYAVGNCGGAPKVYTEDWLREEAEQFRAWMQREDSIYFKSFAIERGYHPNRLQEFANKSPEFAGALEIAKVWQEQKLVNFGLWNKTNSGMTKFVLVNCHDWDRERVDETNRSHVATLARGIRSEVIAEAETGDSDVEQEN